MSQISRHDATAAALRGHMTDVYQKVVDDGMAEIKRLRERLDAVTKEREEALGYEIKLRAERDQLRLSNERLREALMAWQKFDNSNLRNYPITVLIDNQQNARAITAAALTAESGTEGKAYRSS